MFRLRLFLNFMLVMLFNGLSVDLKDLLRQDQLILVYLELKITNQSKNLKRIRVYFLVKSLQDFIESWEKSNDIIMQKIRNIVISDGLEVKRMFNIRLENLIELLIQVNLFNYLRN